MRWIGGDLARGLLQRMLHDIDDLCGCQTFMTVRDFWRDRSGTHEGTGNMAYSIQVSLFDISVTMVLNLVRGKFV